MTKTQWMVHSSFHDLRDFSSYRILQMSTHSEKIKQVSEIPSFSLMNLFRSLRQRNPMKNVMKIWWLKVSDNKNFLADQNALQTYYWHQDKK